MSGLTYKEDKTPVKQLARFTTEETWEDLTVLLVAASFLDCLGSFWHRTQQTAQSNSQGGSAQSRCSVPSVRYDWEVFYPCCGLWFVQYHLLSQVPAFLKYIALQRPVSFMTAEIPIFIVLLMKITHHTFF